MDLAGRICLITGASGGIGEALADALVGAGANVVLLARRADALQVVVSRLGADRTIAVPGDVRRLDDLRRGVQAAVDRWGGLDILINNAGIAVMAKLTTLDESLFDDGFKVNVFGPILGVQAALPALKARGGGYIVNISSAMSLRPTPTLAIYSATKAALNVISASLRLELQNDNIKVMTVHPGYIANEFTRNTHAAGDMQDALDKLQAMPSDRTSADAANDIVQSLRDDADVFRSIATMSLNVPL